MRDVLEPIFGESGAVVAQFFIILVLVLVLIGLGYWLFQRYGGTTLVSGGRSRAPRLAVVDSLSIDHRHRLFLVRRDNVEHLILVGKTADLVVEPSIVRANTTGNRARPQGQVQRQPQPQPQRTAPPSAPKENSAPPASAAMRPVAPPVEAAQSQAMQSQAAAAPAPAAAAPAAAAPAARPQSPAPAAAAPAPVRSQSTGISEPIPFPQGRRPQSRSTATAAAPAEPATVSGRSEIGTNESTQPRRASARTAAPATSQVAIAASAGTATASAHFEEPARPTQIDSVFSLAETLDDIADEPRSEPIAGAQPPPVAAPPVASTPVRQSDTAQSVQAEITTVSDGMAPETASNATNDEAVETANGGTEQDESASKVSNLEQEMARLLGEITSKRES